MVIQMVSTMAMELTNKDNVQLLCVFRNIKSTINVYVNQMKPTHADSSAPVLLARYP